MWIATRGVDSKYKSWVFYIIIIMCVASYEPLTLAVQLYV